jgi:hypothetical protein
MTDALTKLLIEKGTITDAEFKQKLLEERGLSAHSESDNANNHYPGQLVGVMAPFVSLLSN